MLLGILTHQLSTGVVIALHGKETSAGNFLVEDILEAGIPPQITLPSISKFFPILACSFSIFPICLHKF